MPLRPELPDCLVQVHADAPAHADDHCLAIHRFQPAVEVLNEVPRDQREALLCADQRLDGSPLRLQLLLPLFLFAFRNLLELGVELWALALVERDAGQPALVVDGDGSAVLNGALDVVDGDVIAEDRPRILVAGLDGCTGEADERGVRERVTQVPREPVDEVVLAPVRLVGDDDDVAPVGQERVSVAAFIGEELLDGREDHAT